MTTDRKKDPTRGALHLDKRPKPAPKGTARELKVRGFVIEAARLISDLHCEHVVVYDVRGISDLTDYIVIASGTSDRQIKGVASQVCDLAQNNGLERFGSERDADSTWLVLDFVDSIIHLFEPATRAHYDLEMLWGDAPQVTWQRDVSPGHSDSHKDGHDKE